MAEVTELGDKDAAVKQILVITDGCSNLGGNPVDSAAQARKKNVVVNVIGVVDKGDMGREGREEAMSIADAGGGLCRIVHPLDLSSTVQMLTHQTMQMTLHQVVNEQLLQVVGKDTEDLEPSQRAKVMQVVDKLEEEVGLWLTVVVDTSASMKDKMGTVREAIEDLSLSLQARRGESQVAIIAFPGPAGEATRLIHSFSTQLDMQQFQYMLVARGGTPTAEAIDKALTMFEKRSEDNEETDYPEHRWTGEGRSS
jgi:Ca-activated chloride channel family protein